MADTQGVMKEIEAKMTGALEALGRELATVRTGRASAPISTARRAPAVSVVKNGLPVPAAKTTTRPFSR